MLAVTVVLVIEPSRSREPEEIRLVSLFLPDPVRDPLLRRRESGWDHGTGKGFAAGGQ